MLEKTRPTVSIIIKAFNEERHIAAAIESALKAFDGLHGEVILADAASTDRTVAIARNYPIKIARLDKPADRSCGAGAQLGYQYSSGKFLYLMDGDMRLDAGFLAAGVRYLEENPAVGGVGGGLVDRDVENLEYAQRAQRFDPDRRPGPVSRLNGSGLYRRAAVDSIGYVTDRNLHGGEELDIAARLQARGWTLARIDCHAIDHYGHSGNAFRLLLRRMRNRNSFGPGEIARAALGKAHFGYVMRNDRNLLLSALVAGWWASMLGAAYLMSGWHALLAVAATALVPFAAMTIRWRSLRNALYSLAIWNVHALCFLPGFLRPRKPPTEWMASTLVHDASAVRGEALVKRA